VIYTRLHARLVREETSEVRGQLFRSVHHLLGCEGHIERQPLLVRVFKPPDLALQSEALAPKYSARIEMLRRGDFAALGGDFYQAHLRAPARVARPCDPG